MITGCNTLSFVADGDDAKAVETIAKAGFGSIDLNLNVYAVRRPVSPFWSLPEAELLHYAEDLKKRADSLGVVFGQVHAPYPTYFEGNGNTEPSEILRIMKSSILIASALKSHYIVIHPNVPPSAVADGEVEAAVESNFAFYSNFFEDLKRSNVCVGIENMFNWDKAAGKALPTVASTAECMAYMTDRLNELCGEKCFAACLDTGHAMLSGGGDLPHMVHTLGSRLKLLHVHDNDAQRDRHWLPFDGVVDWKAFAKALAEEHYGGILSLEIKTDAEQADNAFSAAEKLKLLIKEFSE